MRARVCVNRRVEWVWVGARRLLRCLNGSAGCDVCSFTANSGDTKAQALPITFACFSRPGNDPMKRSKENQVCGDVL